MNAPAPRLDEPWPWADCEELARWAEAYETPQWAVNAILDVEILTGIVVDPCCGRGVMAKTADARGYHVYASDKYDWGYSNTGLDFLTSPSARYMVANNTVFMNPPFSRATDFVQTSLEEGARKIVCFQRFAWYESRSRTDFWETNPPNRIYVLADRATCWRIDIPPEKRTSGTTTAHAWFVWEYGQPAGTQLGRLSKKVYPQP